MGRTGLAPARAHFPELLTSSSAQKHRLTLHAWASSRAAVRASLGFSITRPVHPEKSMATRVLSDTLLYGTETTAAWRSPGDWVPRGSNMQEEGGLGPKVWVCSSVGHCFASSLERQLFKPVLSHTP